MNDRKVCECGVEWRGEGTEGDDLEGRRRKKNNDEDWRYKKKRKIMEMERSRKGRIGKWEKGLNNEG